MEVQGEWHRTRTTDPETLILPSVPKHDPSSRPVTTGLSLPDIKSLGLPDAQPPSGVNITQAHQWLPLQPSNLPSVPTGAPRQSIETVGSPMETETVFSFDGNNVGHRETSVMSSDDAETRMAAEALSGLRNLDFMRSPSVQSTSTIQPSRWPRPMSPPAEEEQEPEPLLQLLTTSHPWIGNTINGSLSAYNATKHYSPAFLRSSADFLERNIGTPVASTFETVSKRTGVESGLRRYLGERRPSDMENPGTKRRRVKEDSMDVVLPDVEKGLTSPPVYHYRSRAGSQASFATLESLPAYDENRSPKYEEEEQSRVTSPQPQQAMPQHRPAGPIRRSSHNWRTQLMITTSGLGAALHTNSLRSLKYCLRLLKNANDHVAAVMDALKTLLNQYAATQQQNDEVNGSASYNLSEEQQAASRAIAERIRALGDDIMNTLRSVVEAVSRYSGGALPENASALVRRQLMSVPQRWRVASETGDANSEQTQDEAIRQGNRLLAFASQSLDMFAQVSLVLSSTIDSAESWLETMGRQRRERSQSHQQLPNSQSAPLSAEKLNGFTPLNDVKTGEKH